MCTKLKTEDGKKKDLRQKMDTLDFHEKIENAT
jgi:hypothetical protein